VFAHSIDLMVNRGAGVMSRQTIAEMRSLEGRQVRVTLADGSHIDPLPDVVDIWEVRAA
jgi:hypothetical protein